MCQSTKINGRRYLRTVAVEEVIFVLTTLPVVARAVFYTPVFLLSLLFLGHTFTHFHADDATDHSRKETLKSPSLNLFNIP